MTLKKWHSLRSPLAFACTLVILLPNPVNVLAQPASSSQNKPKPQLNQTPINPKRKVIPLKFKLPPKGAPNEQMQVLEVDVLF